ncbi:peptidase M16 [Pseudomonas floridensis]|uniref:Peptidase M16 n=1 Tax=Pseudomonas floridensis TaxID=1958950 RepID=A0A1X0NA82_9PSED|nr:M16 family metallopeptidase [Pseudomonas floridensis]ORC60884.1 peptidase M16 [Pseudomonas floridensis]
MNKIIVSLTGLWMLVGCAQFSDSRQPRDWDSQITRGQLSNGLQYRLVREASQPGRIDMRLTVKAGSVDEADDQVGVAHMVEHLNFYSRGPQPQTIRSLMNQWGWTQGRHYNAVTNYDRTQYLLSPPGGAAQVEQALQALSILTLAQDYSADNLERERLIVIEEWRGGLGVAQRMNDQRTASQRIGSRYPAHRTIGNEAAIRSAPLTSLKDFQKRWYVPNNMLLTVVGDIDPTTLPARIEHWFGQAKPGHLPDKDYRELPLHPTLKVVRLQDSQSGSNQVSLLFRLHEPASRAPTLDGTRERLIDRLTLNALQARLRRQPREPGVRSLTVQKSLIGERSSVLGIAAGVDGQSHDVALRQLLNEIERLRRFGLQATDMDKERGAIRAVARRMLVEDKPRDFEQWVTDLNDATAPDKVLSSKREIATQYLAVLDTVTLDDLNARFKRWTDNQDRVLQLSAPGLTALDVPTVDAVQRLMTQVRASELAAPQTAASSDQIHTQDLPDAPDAGSPGTVIDRKRFTGQNVEHWQLSNGDTLIWLKRNGDNGRLVMQADSSAGFMTPRLPYWRSQMAAQLAGQSAPEGWSEEQIRRWRSESGTSLSLNQQADRLQIDVSTADAKKDLPAAQRLQALLQTYRLSQSVVRIDDTAVEQARDELADSLSRKTHNVREQQDQALRVLQYGQEDWFTPGADEVAQVQPEQLNSDWQRLSRAPATYYLMADVEPQVLQPLVERELAAIKRGAPLQPTVRVQRDGRHQQSLAIGIEPRALLNVLTFKPHPWTPEDAARISALQDIANAALKQQLRGEASGVYRLSFDSTLSQQHQRIESRLSFSSDPARVEELWQLARKTLATLPAHVSEKDAAAARRHLEQQERLRRDDPQTQLRRLILSERHWGDPRYLTEQARLPDALTVTALKRLAGELFNATNQVQLRLLPAPKTATEALAGQ